MVSPKEAHPYRELVRHLWPHAVVFGRRGYGEVLALLREGSVDVAFLCSLAAGEVVAHGYGEVVAQSVPAGWTRYRALAIVPQGSSHRTLGDLVGATVALVDPLSNTGRARFFQALRREGFQPERMFRRMVYTYSHDRAVEAVARGLVDVAAVDGMVLDTLLRARPEWRNRIRVLWEGPEDPPPPVVVRADLSPAWKARVIEDLLQAGDHLLSLGIVGFRPASGKPYADLWREVRR